MDFPFFIAKKAEGDMAKIKRVKPKIKSKIKLKKPLPKAKLASKIKKARHPKAASVPKEKKDDLSKQEVAIGAVSFRMPSQCLCRILFSRSYLLGMAGI